MKERRGFVSNSSSSSFVVGFKSIPRSVEEVEKLLFPDGEAYDNRWSNTDFATTVFNELEGKMPMSLNEVAEEFASGWLIDMDDWEKAHKDELDACQKKGGMSLFHKYFEKHDKEKTRRAKALAKEWTKINKNLFFFCFEYGDEGGGYFSQMEHGGLFSNLPHKTISKH